MPVELKAEELEAVNRAIDTYLYSYGLIPGHPGLALPEDLGMLELVRGRLRTALAAQTKEAPGRRNREPT